MEPAGDVPVGNEPVIGWRVWALANNRLYSIGKNAFWRPGENQAECLAGHTHDVPAPLCHCGFWAIHNPVSAMELAARLECGLRMGSGFTVLDPHRTVAVGLVLGYGAIAVHGGEGYRAGLASVACIFADAPEALVTEKANLRRTVANEYGVPCVALDAAISIGFLQELGVRRQAVEQIRVWIKAGRPLQRDPQRELTEQHRQILQWAAQGMTTEEIARSMSLNSRAAEANMRRLIENINSRNRAGLPWVRKHRG